MRRVWGSSYLKDPVYERLQDHRELPPPPLPHSVGVKKRTSAATAQKFGQPSEPSSTDHGEQNVASDPRFDQDMNFVSNWLKSGTYTKLLMSPTNNILEEGTFLTGTSASTFQHMYGQDKNMESQHRKDIKTIPAYGDVSRTINGHLDLPLPNGAHMFNNQVDHKSFGAAAISNVESTGGESHPKGSSLEEFLQAIINRHGDISKECYFKSKFVIVSMLEGICIVMQDLEGKRLEELKISSLVEYDSFLNDAEKMNFNVKWLRLHVAELLDAVKSFEETKEAGNENFKLVK